MSTALAIFSGILYAELTFIGLFILLVLLMNLVDFFDKKLNPHYPMCDIDPRCHPAFCFDKNGDAWIGSVKVTIS